MPRRTDISSILIIGAGPIVIGQACEFDYSGTQACKALKAEGYRVILVNSNPATIMTDPDLADATYIEPITPEIVAKIIEKERPDALLPTMGGQTALNTALSLRKMGVLEKFGVKMIGATADAIDKAEDRKLFREAMHKIGLATPRSHQVKTLIAALEALDDIGLPAIIRPSFTLGGTGGGIAYNKAEFIEIVERGIDASPTSEVLIEESVLGWKEFEMEVVRDKNDNCIIVCSIENIDPMGVHTGDSITVAPALTLTDKEYQIMRDASIAVLREIGVETGGSNVQFAVNPLDGRLLVIEMNPRVSRSSALASKATGFPIAKVAAKLAVGYTLDEIANDITGGATPASFEPSIDYVVTKVPRFAFEKFPGAEPVLTTSMKSVGEAMAIGRTFQESLQKALRSLETGLTGLDEVAIPGLGEGDDKNAIRAALGTPSPDGILKVAQAMRLGMNDADIHTACRIDPWFLGRSAMSSKPKPKSAPKGCRRPPARCAAQGHGLLRRSPGPADRRLRGRRRRPPPPARRAPGVQAHRHLRRRIRLADRVYVFDLRSAVRRPRRDEAAPSDKKKVVILGGGPNRIGQGIEFDYCCCHAAFALKDVGYETIMINCNPETVSTDYDTSDRLYFEPLTAEDVIEIIETERKNGVLHGVIVQFGGQTPLKLAEPLEKAQVPILGTSPDAIDLAEDRDRFKQLLDRLKLRSRRAASPRHRKRRARSPTRSAIRS
jgi:carbamoyl-phosphate synthase large subunit